MPRIVGISGGTGSGKTTLAQHIVATLPPKQAVVIQHDWYYRDRSGLSQSAREQLNFDEPDALENELLANHLSALKDGKTVACPQYDFVTHTRMTETRSVHPAPVIVVEGILLFATAILRQAMDLRIFVDTDDDIRLLRRLSRDLNERGEPLKTWPNSISARFAPCTISTWHPANSLRT